MDEVAQATEGFSGADLQALIYNAHLEVVNASIASSVVVKGTLPKEKERTIRYTAIGQARIIRSRAEELALQRRVGASRPIASVLSDCTSIASTNTICKSTQARAARSKHQDPSST